jgi:hypothetical protein
VSAVSFSGVRFEVDVKLVLLEGNPIMHRSSIASKWVTFFGPLLQVAITVLLHRHQDAHVVERAPARDQCPTNMLVSLLLKLASVSYSLCDNSGSGESGIPI